MSSYIETSNTSNETPQYDSGVQEILQEKYMNFKRVLSDNYAAMESISYVDDVYRGSEVTGTKSLMEQTSAAHQYVLDMIDGLKGIYGEEKFNAFGFDKLNDAANRIGGKINTVLTQRHDYSNDPLVLPFDKITKEMGTLVGWR